MSTTTVSTVSQHAPLRLVVAGSVDDGKSTLVGRLLHDSKSILADQYDAVESASRSRGATEFDLALLTDGLRAEREQGITIDVAYRYFKTDRRSFILADTPGHVQYTRNTVTGASTADAAVVLVDVRNGASAQTRRHSALLSLLRVRHVVFAVNKMDAVDWSQDRFEQVQAELHEIARGVGLGDVVAVPVSALTGEGVVRAAPDWYLGRPLLALLEELDTELEDTAEPFRMPVQLVIRPRTAQYPDYRGLAGRVASGRVQMGDVVHASPSGTASTVIAIDTPTGPAEVAVAGQSVTIRLAEELDIARGEVLTTDDPIAVTRVLDAVVTWMGDAPSAARQRVLVKAGTKTVRAMLGSVTDIWDVSELRWTPSSAPLQLNDIGRCTVQLAEDVAIDEYRRLRGTGAFVVVDPATGATLAACMSGADLGALVS
ncbi:sulfate adenylyltransferase subunit 1 [Allobranchiibius sp. GilTou73]|uniref:sulfate adenylyltransferase subunit 1 n=1 Tax=Allobranchiibius sp. GilTou73 TaxID=2904523 RepID=UPI001F30CD47|nr:GTP-binding protein [Allobranchiibius sp. GilTou73]UIJ34420.1 GTP-binding protein [Allobranchiibius sp. GilTou73]